MRWPSTEATHIDSTLTESRKFPPSAEFSAKAWVKSLDEYQALCNRADTDPEAILGRMRAQPALVQAVRQNARMEFPACEVVRRRHDQRRVQLPRSPSRHAAPQQGRADLGRRAGRLARADLPDARRRSGPMRQRAQEPRREGRATASRSTCRWCRRRRSRCWRARESARFIRSCSAASRRRRWPIESTTPKRRSVSPPTADGGAGRSSSSSRMSMTR